MVNRVDNFYYKGYIITIQKYDNNMQIMFQNGSGIHVTEIPMLHRKYKDILLDMKFAVDSGVAHFEHYPSRYS